MNLQIACLAFVSLLISACASRGTVVVRSDPPDASVYLFDAKTGQNSLLGKTPLTFSKTLAEDRDSDIFQLRVEKDGFETKQAAVAALGRSTTYVDLKLPNALAKNLDLHKAFEVNRRLMLEATRLASAKRFAEALVRVEKVIETDPKNDDALAAKGSLLYLMKDFDGAQTAWSKALEANPSNDAVRASLVDLNLSLDKPNRTPASSEGP